MTQYTVIVDDNYGGITYGGPGPDDWNLNSTSSQYAYQGTVHMAQNPNARLTFPFTGAQQIVVRGSFIGENNVGTLATYPIFQVNSTNLNCTPNPPQNGGQFLCSTSLPSDNVNRTLTMFLPPDASEGQFFHIDYIRYGSNSQEAEKNPGTTLFIQSPLPNSNTTGLKWDGSWQKVKILGPASDVGSVMQTSTADSKVTFNFKGSSVAWWNCCMPPDTPGNAASGTYSIDGSDDVAFQIDSKEFLQGPQCKDEKILFQTNQLQDGNHTMVVTYNGDNTKMPLTLCALAATPLSFENLDPSPQGPHSNGSNHSDGHDHDDSSSSSKTSGSNTPVIVGVIAGVVFAFVCMFIVVYVLRRKRARDIESRISFDAPRLAVRRVVPSISLSDHEPPTRRTSVDKESILEVPPPFYRSSMAKSRFSWRSLSFRAGSQPYGHQQTAYVGSDYGGSVASFNPRESTQSYYHSYQQPPGYHSNHRATDPDPILPLP